jgi:hypothetical protein
MNVSKGSFGSAPEAFWQALAVSRSTQPIGVNGDPALASILA